MTLINSAIAIKVTANKSWDQSIGKMIGPANDQRLIRNNAPRSESVGQETIIDSDLRNITLTIKTDNDRSRSLNAALKIAKMIGVRHFQNDLYPVIMSLLIDIDAAIGGNKADPVGMPIRRKIDEPGAINELRLRFGPDRNSKLFERIANGKATYANFSSNRDNS